MSNTIFIREVNGKRMWYGVNLISDLSGKRLTGSSYFYRCYSKRYGNKHFVVGADELSDLKKHDDYTFNPSLYDYKEVVFIYDCDSPPPNSIVWLPINGFSARPFKGGIDCFDAADRQIANEVVDTSNLVSFDDRRNMMLRDDRVKALDDLSSSYDDNPDALLDLLKNSEVDKSEESK